MLELIRERCILDLPNHVFSFWFDGCLMEKMMSDEAPECSRCIV